MKMKSFKQRVLREKEQPYISMQKTQGPKNSMSSPNLNLRFKSKTNLNKQNHQPNLQNAIQRPFNENSFGAAKMVMRQTVDDLKLQINKEKDSYNFQSHTHIPLSNRRNYPKFSFLSKSNNFERCITERNLNAFSKKHLKTQEAQYEQDSNCPIIQDCQLIKSEYQSSQDSGEEEKLNYAKCYQGHSKNINTQKHVLIHQSFNYDEKPRQMITFCPNDARNFKKYQFSREQQKKMKNQIVNNIIMSSKAELMRSCDLYNLGGLKCVNHTNKKAKYRLLADLTDDQEQVFYCSKCAVNLAKQGFPIQQISAVDRRMLISKQTETQNLYNSVDVKSQQAYREEQLKIFQKRLESLKNKISSKLIMFGEKSEKMTKIDKKIQLTISNYDHLIEILKQMKDKEILKEQKLRKQKSSDVNLKRHELSTILDNIKDTAYEINNEKSKLMALKNKQFTFMFDSYINKISSYEHYLCNLQQTQLALEIAIFDQNLASQEIDEETMVHNIFDQMYKRLTNPKLEALVNESKKQLPGKSIKNSMNQGLQSGGSSMFYCEEEEEQQNRPPFRILFQNNKQDQFAMHEKSPNMINQNMKNSFNVNSSIQNPCYRTVKYFKEQNYLPNTYQHR